MSAELKSFLDRIPPPFMRPQALTTVRLLLLPFFSSLAQRMLASRRAKRSGVTAELEVQVRATDLV